jgi:arylsulfatase A-like enzyme
MEELADLDTKGMRPILEALEATGQLANTVIFFTPDNGYLHGEHRERKKDLPYWERTKVPGRDRSGRRPTLPRDNLGSNRASLRPLER